MSGSFVRQLEVAGGACALFAAIVFPDHAAITRVAAAPAVPRCSNTQLSFTRAGTLGGAAGHVGVWFRFHKLWGSRCALAGFPGIGLLDKNFRSLSDTVGRSGNMISSSIPIRVVVLDGQHDAYFALEYGDVPVNNRPCRTVPYLLAIPPNARLPIVGYSGTITDCSGNRIDVSPVLPTRVLG